MTDSALTAAQRIRERLRKLSTIWDDEPVYQDAGVIEERIREAEKELRTALRVPVGAQTYNAIQAALDALVGDAT